VGHLPAHPGVGLGQLTQPAGELALVGRRQTASAAPGGPGLAEDSTRSSLGHPRCVRSGLCQPIGGRSG